VTASLSAIGHDGAAFAFLDGESRTFRIGHAHGVPAEYAQGTHSAASGMPALVAERQATVVMHDYLDSEHSLPALRAAGFRTAIAAPVWVEGELAAVLLAFDRRRLHLDAEDIEAVEALAEAASTALTNALRFEFERQSARGHERASLTDPLTGVGNRRQGDRLLASLAPGDAVIVIDLDYFKSINDSFGHLVGDEVLAAVGAHLRAHVRGADTIARVGGEEFLAVLRSMEGDADRAAERLVAGWREQRPLTTISAGMALHREGEAGSTTYAHADAALYAAKRGGRDRSQTWNDGLSTGQGLDAALVSH
jgi:diguanylate cyclase (GGDEF)-like protein